MCGAEGWGLRGWGGAGGGMEGVEFGEGVRGRHALIHLNGFAHVTAKGRT